MKNKTIFLSHSSKDIEKVRKIRDILEALDYDPLLFHMKCLDDDNETLEDFIKKEIDARNVFVYCKSKNSESSVWVQKELLYIKSSANKRLYEIDIEKPLSDTLVIFLNTLAKIIQRNKIFISCSHADRIYSDKITSILDNNGYDVVRYTHYNREESEQHANDVRQIALNGIFMPIITSNYLSSVYCMSELDKAFYPLNEGKEKIIFKPICVGAPIKIIKQLLPSYTDEYSFFHISNIESLLNEDNEKDFLKYIEKENINIR